MTKNAKKLLEFLRKYIEKNKISPNYEEMKEHMGLKSKSSIFQYLEYLEELGHIKKDKLKSRSIELNSVIPFYNEISAGKPIDVLNDQIEYIDVNNFIKSDKANCIACKVHGNSMESYGIFEDDIIIVERVTNYNSNDIHAVQIDDSEITLKKIKLIKDEIEIFGDHKNFSSVRYKKDRVKILGKMVNLVRKY
jgi:repressor LexA|tara:strand:- start:305 stop:883 length:579 start_codon:yes stop_codon:yes gene_type:complete